MDNKYYDEVFVKSYVLNDAHSIQHVLDGIGEQYPTEKGWEVSYPEITANPDGKTVTIKVNLKKNSMIYGLKGNDVESFGKVV